MVLPEPGGFYLLLGYQISGARMLASVSTWAQGGQKAASEPTPFCWTCMGKRSVLVAVAGVPEPEESEIGNALGINLKECQALACHLTAEREAWLLKPLSHQPEPKASVPYTLPV